LSGNAYIYFDKEEAELLMDRIYVFKPDKITPKFSKLGVLLYWEYVDEFGRIKEYDADNILHIKTSNIVKDDNCHYSTGLSPLEAGWIIVQSSDQKFEAEASIFKNRGIIGIVSSNSDTPMLPKERNRLQEEFDGEMGGASKYNKVKISSTKLNYMQTGMSPTDLKLLEGIISSLRLICGLYGMPSFMLPAPFLHATTAHPISFKSLIISGLALSAIQ